MCVLKTRQIEIINYLIPCCNLSIFSNFSVSLLNYLVSEVTRGYVLENDEERYTTRREKMYTFMKIPREVEKFMSYGFFHCLDSFLFVFTFLPIRFLTAFLKLVFKTPLYILRYVIEYRYFHRCMCYVYYLAVFPP